jgi:hypothetical protein
LSTTLDPERLAIKLRSAKSSLSASVSPAAFNRAALVEDRVVEVDQDADR